MGQTPVLKPAPQMNYGPPTLIIRPALNIPAASSWNPMPAYEVMGTVSETHTAPGSRSTEILEEDYDQDEPDADSP